MKRVYISGKISGLQYNQYFCNFITARNKCRNLGFKNIINPVNIPPFLGLNIWICHIINDIWIQSSCTHTAFMHNWKDSRGARWEMFFAKYIFKHEIIYL